jgi:hypothetical protein
MLAGLALWAVVDAAIAQQPAPACDAAALPADLGGWCTRRPAASAADSKGLAAARLEVGRAYRATLTSTGDVHYIARPEKPGGSVSFGGMFTFTVKDSGTYRVALGSGAWIDLLKDAKAVASTAHGHGPEGSGIRKMVDFPLAPGRYTLQIAANGEPALTLMIVRLP